MGKKGINLKNLLFKTLSVIKNNDKLNFLNLILLLLLQSILDVISIASLIPILYIFQSDMEIKINNFFMKYGLGELFSDKSTISIFIPLIAISIMLISTLTKLITETQ